ncbi:MAG: hypothetical protein AABY32_04330 [Nanoarchaeota archaeon]
MKSKFQYDDHMDKPCIDLCNAINEIPGLITNESCSGHGRYDFQIWFRAETIIGLYIVARAIDRRYGGPATRMNDKCWSYWECHVEDTDLTEDPVHFRLTSNGVQGRMAYSQARKIFANIRQFLDNKKLMEMFKISKKE